MPPNFQLKGRFLYTLLVLSCQVDISVKNAHMTYNQEIILLNLTLSEIHRPNKSSLR